MLKIENTEVLGWEHAIRGMRNPMNSWEKSDSKISTCECEQWPHSIKKSFDEVGPDDQAAQRWNRSPEVHENDRRVCGPDGAALLVEGIRYLQSRDCGQFRLYYA